MYDATDAAKSPMLRDRFRWQRHDPYGWLFGWTYWDGWLLLHVGPGFVEIQVK